MATGYEHLIPVKTVSGYDHLIPRQSPSALAQFGQSAASLADMVVGDIPAAIAGAYSYAGARASGQSPEQATVTSGSMAAPFESPFGNLFGVTDTPNYQQEASRRFFGAVGENVMAPVSNALARTTGMSEPDAQNMLGTALFALPQAVRGGRQAAGAAKQAVSEIPAVKARTDRIAQQKSQVSYDRASKIDAAKAAQRIDIGLNPADSNPTAVNRAIVAAAGEAGVNDKLAQSNIPKWNKLAREDLGLPKNTPLTDSAFDQARNLHSAPYDKVRTMGQMTPDATTIPTLEGLRIPELIGGAENKAKIDRLVDDAVLKIESGIDGEIVVKNIREQRKQANAVYNAQKSGSLVSPSQMAEADARMGIADTLEGLIESNIRDPKALSDFKKARTALAKTYDWERATSVTGNQVDPMQVVKLAEKGKKLTGVLLDISKVAGNYPKISSLTKMADEQNYQRLRRGGAGATLGAVTTGFNPAGVIGGAALGFIGSEVLANRLTKPGVQRRFAMPEDNRIPLARQEVPPIPQNRSVVPYTTPQELLMPGEGPYQPNFTLQPNQYGPRVTASMPEGGPPALNAPSAQGTMNALRTEDLRARNMAASLDEQAQAAAESQSMATRRPASREVILDFDPITNKYRTGSQGLKGATPDTFVNFGASLETAANKVSKGTRFDMTAAEKVAWERTKVDLAEVAPGLKALSDKAVAEKMLDRTWVEQASAKAREKAAAFDEIANRAANDQSRQSAIMNRERLMDLVDQLDESLRTPRPVSRGGQGPKTQAFQRNMLTPEQEIQNALLK